MERKERRGEGGIGSVRVKWSTMQSPLLYTSKYLHLTKPLSLVCDFDSIFNTPANLNTKNHFS